MDSAILLAAARFERDRRAERYPALIRDQKVAPGETDAQLEERLTLDYQCWVAIAEWLDSGDFYSFAGGAEPWRPDAPVVRWAELERTAAAALASVTTKIERREADPEQLRVEPAKRLTPRQYLDELTALYVRRGGLVCTHRAVQLRRQTIDAINAELHARPEQVIAA